MKKLLLLFLASSCLASGPKYTFKDPLLNDELDNVYKDIKTAGALKGTTTNNNAVAGNIGEYISATQVPYTSLPGATGVFGSILTIALTPGDWDVSGLAIFHNNGATITTVAAGVGTSGTVISGDSRMDTLPPTAASDSSVTIPGVRFSIATNTNIQLEIAAMYSAGSPLVAGRLSARRVR